MGCANMLQVRFTFLDNQTLGSLSHHAQIPQDLLLAGCTQRLRYMDNSSVDVKRLVPSPRPTYCCNLLYGLPGGCNELLVEVEAIWDQVIRLATVRVSGVSEGHPDYVLSSEADVSVLSRSGLSSVGALSCELLSAMKNIGNMHPETHCMSC